MTIMDRLARKGIVERRKSGRAYIYRPTLSVEDARTHALGQIVESFFGGSREIAAEYLRDGNSRPGADGHARPAMAMAGAASVSSGAGRAATMAANVNSAIGETDRTVAIAATNPAAPDATANSGASTQSPRASRERNAGDDAPPIDATLL